MCTCIAPVFSHQWSSGCQLARLPSHSSASADAIISVWDVLQAAGASALVALAIGACALALLGTAGLVLAVVMAVSGAALAWLAMRQIGGQTGDVLGAMQQITALSAWLALTLV